MGKAAIGQRQEQSHRSGEALEATNAADDTDDFTVSADMVGIGLVDDTAATVSKAPAKEEGYSHSSKDEHEKDLRRIHNFPETPKIGAYPSKFEDLKV
ncbi:MAG: hypothetical protein Q9199_004759 [Rusavskia elegans]